MATPADSPGEKTASTFPYGGVVTLSNIAVSGLFGRFDHRIVLNKDERITIMTAPNGFGKTTILRIIDSLFNRRLRRLAAMPFREVRAGLNNGYRLRVTRKLTQAESLRKLRPTLSLRLYKGTRLEETFTLPRISPDEFPFPVNLIEEWVPTLDRVAPRLWNDLETGESLSLEDVIDRHGHEFPPEPRIKTGTPDWINKLQDAIPVHFVDAERLTIAMSDRYRRGTRRARFAKRVNVYSGELRDRIQKILASYGSLSQSLDQTFPTRLVQQVHQTEIPITKLRDDLAELEAKRRQLVDAGLLKREDAGPNVPPLDVEKVSESKREVLEMFTQDTRKKLSVFDEILARVEILTRIANSRFLHKAVAVNEDGIIVTTPDGEPLKLAMLSSGEQHELVLLYGLLFRVPGNALIMIDEPELSLHVAWQEEFLSDINDIAALSGCRVLLATHSPQIIGNRYDLTTELKGPS